MQPNHQETDRQVISIFKECYFLCFRFDFNSFNVVEQPISGKQSYYEQLEQTHVPDETEILLIYIERCHYKTCEVTGKREAKE